MDVNKISNRTVFRILLVISGFFGLLVMIYVLRRPLVWLIIAAFLAVALNPPVNRIARYMPRKSRGLATGLLLLVILTVLGLLLYALVPPLVSQTQSFVRDLPGLVERMRQSDSSLVQAIAQSEPLTNLNSANQSMLLSRLSGLSGSLVDVIRSVFGSVIATLTVLVLTFFMIAEGPHWAELFWRVQDPSRRLNRRRIANKMARVVTGYTNGRLIISGIAGGISIVVMTIVGVPYAVPLGIIVSLFGLMPLVGATLGAVVVVVVALINSVSDALIMSVFFVIYQQFENNLIQPYVDSKTVQLSPLTALVSALLGISLAGVLGALLAIPAGACLQILAKEYAGKRWPASAKEA
jgi:predicted PurR-regulated permease PerM